MLVLNVVYPLVPEQIAAFCAGKRAVLVLEEGQPEFIEQDIATSCAAQTCRRRLHGKDLLPMAGEYTAEILLQGLHGFRGASTCPTLDISVATTFSTELAEVRDRALAELGGGVPARPPNFCTGCPERPVFAALKLVEREVGPAAHLHRHRLPFLRHVRAVLVRQLDPRLRHEHGIAARR